VKGVVADHGGRGVSLLGHALGVAGRHVHRHGLDPLRALLAELGEEGVQGGGVVAFVAPHDAASAVIGDQGEVVVPFLPADLVHADVEEGLEPVGVEAVVHHPGDDPPHAVPVDAHQPAHRRFVHGGGQPPDQVLEVSAVMRAGPGEGHRLPAHPVGRTAHTAKLRLDLQAPGAEVQVPPRRRHRATVIASGGGELAGGAHQQAAAQRHGDHHPVRLEHHATDPHAGQAQEARECSGDAHRGRTPFGLASTPPKVGTPRARHHSPSPAAVDDGRLPRQPAYEPQSSRRVGVKAARQGVPQGPERSGGP
jgi:hypothetical protein